MPEPARKRATYEDLFHIPENMIGEIIDGELIVSPRPSRRHGYTATTLGGEIVPRYSFGREGPGGWVILIEPEIAFGEDILVPDLAGWRIERFPETEDHNWISVAPDWVCEIISPGSVRMDRIKKMRIYASYQVPYVWLVDPLQAMVEAFKLISGKWTMLGVFAEDDKVRIEPFAEIEIELGNLWLGKLFTKPA